MPPNRRSARTASSTARDSAQPYPRADPKTSSASNRPSATIARPANGRPSIRLTVKAAPSKLRQATSGAAPIPPNPYADNPSESDATPVPATRVARTTRNPRTVVEPESEDDDEDEDGEDEVDPRLKPPDEEMEDVDQELLAHEDSEDEDEDAEGEEDDEEGMEDHPPPPIIKHLLPTGQPKPNVTVTAPNEGPLKSVEDKEMDDDEDEELSELDSYEEGGGEGEDDEEEASSDSDEDNSRSATPDLSKLTRRQRGVYEEEPESSLMALSNEAQKKKHLSEQEQDVRRQEMARRRKNLSEKRNEEEKVRHLSTLPPHLWEYTNLLLDGHNKQTTQKARS